MGQCRWIECRPEGMNTKRAKTVGVPCAATEQISYQERVMNTWNRMRQREINQEKYPNDRHKLKIIF